MGVVRLFVPPCSSAFAVADIVCEPSLRLVRSSPQLAASLSTVQVVLARPEVASLDVTVMSASALALGSLGPLTETDGLTVSTPNVSVLDEPELPATSAIAMFAV